MKSRQGWTNSGVFRILLLCRPYKGKISLSVLLSGGAVTAGLALPLGLRMLMNGVMNKHSEHLATEIAAGLILLFAVRAVLKWSGSYLLQKTGERIVADLRTRTFTRVIGMDVDFFSKERVGAITSRITNDALLVRRAITDGVVTCLYQILQFAGALGIMLWLNWRVTILVLATIPFATVVGIVCSGPIRDRSRKVQDLLGDVASIADEGLAAVRIVKIFNREQHEIRRFQKANEGVYKEGASCAHFTSLFRSITDFLFVAAMVAIFWFGGRELIAGRLTGGDFVAFLFYAERVSQSLTEMAGVYSIFTTAAGASDHIFKLLATKTETEKKTSRAPAPIPAAAIKFNNVSFCYQNGNKVLRGLSFSIAPGEKVAIVGRSGAGKSTLMNLLPRFYDPCGGEIYLDGQPIADMSVTSLRERIAMVTQEVQLFNTSIRENIRYGRLEATEEEITAAAEMANAHDFICGLPAGYDTVVGDRGLCLSGGERQRIAIARALLKDAPLLLLDEPTSSVDSASEAAIHQALHRLMQGRTSIIISHRPRTVQEADRVFILHDGKICESAKAELGINAEMYSEYRAATLDCGLPCSDKEVIEL